ncbi:MAG: twin-arginine translocase TatA/TatE family subunit [Ignavibacteriaceae bacterium]|jgi:sec-independent protein translocase protein TatA|nr:twin-arginine translocase TatA/TatE family subunit [Ignavibacteriaceae bacterium]
MFGNLGAGEIILIVLVILLLFGAKKIPELARGIGKGMSEFKKGLKDVETEIKTADTDVKKVEEKKD